MNQLNDLRKALLKLNDTLFKTMLQRKSVVHKIQKEKHLVNQNVFFPERECELFNNLPQIKNLSIKQLLAFSLIIEDDARSFCHSYPAWSERIHIKVISNELIEQINPILLKAYDSKYFFRLSLTSDFDFIDKL